MAQSQKAPAADVHWRTVHKRKNEGWLFAEDLGGPGTNVNVEVESAGVGELMDSDGKKKAMPFLAFVGKRKKLGLNPTNCKSLTALCGSPVVLDWGKVGRVTLTVVEASYFDSKSKQNETTDAIRISRKRPAPATAAEAKANEERAAREAADRAKAAAAEAAMTPREKIQRIEDDAFEREGQLDDEEKAEIARLEAEEAKRHGG